MPATPLSTDELEALLQDDDPPPARHRARPAAQVRACALGTGERTVREPIPGLDLVAARFERELRRQLGRVVTNGLRVSPVSHRVQRWDALLGSLPGSVHAEVLSLAPLPGNALLTCETNLVFALVDALFGGRGQAPSAHHGPSATERRIAARFVRQVCEALSQGWSELLPIDFQPVRSEDRPDLARIAEAGAPVVTIRLGLRIGAAKGEMSVSIPYASLVPIRDVLYASVAGNPSGADERWGARLATGVQSAEVALVAELASTTATIDELISLKPGDFIELGLQESITAKIDGVPVFDCRYGVSNGRYAIRVQSWLTAAENLTGETDER